MQQLADYLDHQDLVNKFATYAAANGLKRRNLLIRKSHKLLQRYINSRIIYNMLDEEAWNEYINQDDPVIKKALEVFRNHASFPKRPAPSPKSAKKEPLSKAKEKKKRTWSRHKIAFAPLILKPRYMHNWKYQIHA